ncbi:SpoIIE family protein phosphatase [Streptomyces sp. NBC_01190]|uniref:SpoIIE family protein phosphatase n=1 Tax=Streptomyces sp. NBC_01190 TaxID=2903767 RepID=UPI003869FC0F|nr:SpoIIE family protein phosphatase [Streptomyces sp. NBC_01190]
MAESSRGSTPWPADALGLIGAAAALIGGDGTIRGWTDAARRSLGYRADEVVGRSAAMLLPDGATARACEGAGENAGENAPEGASDGAGERESAGAGETPDWAARARAREPWSAVVALRRKDGSEARMTLEGSPLFGGDWTDRADRADWFVTAADPASASFWAPARSKVSQALLARSPVGLSIWDTDLRCVWLNAAAERQDGLLRRQRLGRLITEVQPDNEGTAIAAGMRRVLESGEPIIEREYTWRVPGEDEERVLSASYYRLDGTDGEPIGVVNLATDIDKSRARQHLLLLGRAGNGIGTTLNVTRTAQELADAAVPLLADYATVDLGETVQFGEEPIERQAASESRIPVFRRAGVASIHQELPEALWNIGEVVLVPPESPFTKALLSGESHYEPVLNTGPGTWLDHDPDRARVIAATGMHSLIIVPLRARGVVLGEAVFVRTDNKTPFSGDDLLLIEELVGRAALSLDNARRYTRERAASVALQRNLLPHHLSGGRAVEVASRYLPADTHEGVGGDWFDVIPLRKARVGLVVGDVVGHGINAAALMGQLRTIMRTLADLDLPPAELLARLDRLVLLMSEQSDPADGFGGPMMSCTCLYAIYDPVTRRCTMASAGHPPPALVHPDGTVVFPRVAPGPPIGMGMRSYESLAVELPEGSVIALYTDGLIETRTADLDAGLDRLRAALDRPGLPLEQLCSHVIKTMGTRRRLGAGYRAGQAPAEDDVALLMARTLVLTPEEAAARKGA